MQDENQISDNEENIDYNDIGINVILEAIKHEYVKERERTLTIENKAMSIITILIAVMTIIIPMFPIYEIKGFISKNTFKNGVVIGIFVLVFLSILVLMITDVVLLINAIKVREYRRIEINKLVEEEVINSNELSVKTGLCEMYYNAITSNSDINSDKAKNLEKSMKITLTIIGILCISMMILKFLL